MINLTKYLDRVQARLRRRLMVVLIGPRQCGKIILARESPLYFDLERLV
jgi:predicted AAA+ superfamily ATPase